MATYWENSCSFGLRYVSWYKCLIVSLVFSHLGFWSANLFLIAPFPDLCLLVPLYLFKSSARINEKGDGPYRGFGYSRLFSDRVKVSTKISSLKLSGNVITNRSLTVLVK